MTLNKLIIHGVILFIGYISAFFIVLSFSNTDDSLLGIFRFILAILIIIQIWVIKKDTYYIISSLIGVLWFFVENLDL